MNVWNVGFIYVVISETILQSDFLNVYGVAVVQYILISNVLINLGFYSQKPVNGHKGPQLRVRPVKVKANFIFNLLLFVSAVYFVNTISAAIQSFTQGRALIMSEAVGSFNFISTVIAMAGNIVPIIAAFFFRYVFQYKDKAKFILILLLCVIPQFLWGTRLVLLFSLVAPVLVLVDHSKLTVKRGVLLLILLIGIGGMTSFIKSSRNTDGYRNQLADESLLKKIASFGSSEGIVLGTVEIFRYTNKNGFSYGKESAFSLYFWVPRAIWPQKPTQLSYWFVRTYWSDAPPTYSAAYGYWGELFMDFGYFSLVLFLPFGILLKRLERAKDKSVTAVSFKAILYYSLFPFLFLSVRSPQTAIPVLVGIYIFYRIIWFIIRRFNFFKKAYI